MRSNEIPESLDYKNDFELTAVLEKDGFEHSETGSEVPFISVDTLREELWKLPRELCSPECIDFIEHFLVIDPAKRPTAEEALQHPFVKTTVI